MKKEILLVTVCSPEYFDIQLALYCLKTYLQKKSFFSPSRINIDIDVFAYTDKLEHIVKRILEKKPVVVGFSCYLWNIEIILKISRIIKQAVPLIKVILGGPEVSPRSEELLKKEKSIDIVVSGEGEESFCELINNFFYQQIELYSIQGISYRMGGRIFINPSRPPIVIEKIPSPYLERIIDIKKGQIIPIETMRGCPYRCHYCYYHKEFDRVRYFSLRRLEKEFKYILSKQPSEVYLMDSTFNVDSNRAKKILRIFKKYNKGSGLHVELKAELLDEEMVELLHKANVKLIEIGLQSTNSKVFKFINRDFAKNAFKRNIKLLNKRNIYFQIQLIDGLPGDTYGDLKKSLDWLYPLNPPEIRIMRLRVLPGTYLRQHAERFAIEYNPRPPYFSYKSGWMSKDDLKRVDKLRHGLPVLYHIAFRRSIYILKKKLKNNFSDILEEWVNWRGKKKEFISKQIQNFVKYLANKYRNPNLYEEMYPIFKNDLVKFYVEIYKVRKESNRIITEAEN